MGLFSWLRAKPDQQVASPDVVWLTRSAQVMGIATRLQELVAHAGTKSAVLLVPHFLDNLPSLEAIAAAGEWRDFTATALAEDLARLDSLSSLNETHRVEILVVERHPLRSRDEAIVDFARNLPCRSRATFHMSLDDALLREFSGEWTANVLRKLGMKESEPIESKMVARRLAAAQHQIESRVGRELPASSTQEWLELNAPPRS
ncbi:MAG: hypothetical protein JNG90_09670 [Planctomycetaceae bacterium]|nr:hypothetical protein [Planctomycetaceae bacterium]